MKKRNKFILITIGLLAVALLAFLGDMLGKKGQRFAERWDKKAPTSCAFDGTKVNPFYEVSVFLDDHSTLSFCSTYCAARWAENNRDKVVYILVTDEATGQRFDAGLGYFVESDVVSVPEVRSRVHSFSNKEDALDHARQFRGKLIDNPLGPAFVLPQVAQLDSLRIGTPLLPDSLPLRLAVLKPIFKENRLNVTMVPLKDEAEAARLFQEGSIDAVVCDLPCALVLTRGASSARTVKNVLRPNPYRPLFALVAGAQSGVQHVQELEGRNVAVPAGTSYGFYLDFYLTQGNAFQNKIAVREVKGLPEAWEALDRGEVADALLRTPYTELANRKQFRVLADDRNLPWMSVLVVNQALMQNASALTRFLYGLEQSILALNLKPDEYRGLLKREVGIPSEISKEFPMPIFEGANAPSRDEADTVLVWLRDRQLIGRGTTYADLVNTDFLPDPKNVGLAFCCR